MYKYAYVSEANDAWAHNAGYKYGKELLGLSLDDFMPRSRPESIASLKELIRDNYRVEDWETIEVYKNNTKRIFLNNTVGIIENGFLKGAWCVSRDITERKMAEEALIMSKKDLQKLSGRLIKVQEAESRRLAREMHDDLTQRLAVLAIKAGKMERQFNNSSHKPPIEDLREIREQLVKISEDVHSISRQLHPSIIEDLGLVRAIESEIANFSKRQEVKVMFSSRDIPKALSQDLSLCLFRIIQESLRNISKHAQANEAEISLNRLDGSLFLTIKDKGIGFDPKQVRKKPGLGLSSMRERVRLVNGKISIHSGQGQGTVVEVHAPLNQE
jgi:PAS domain S-box-containing protein